MAISPLLSLSVNALAANYAALQTTGHNIANANVAGYSRQQVEFVTATGQFTGAGFFGRGVDIATVSRSHDDFMVREAASAKSLAAMDGARLEQLRRLEGVFKPGEAGLGHATNSFLNAMIDLSSHPADASARQVVLARAGDLAARFNDAGNTINDLQTSLTSALKANVSEVNSLAVSISKANQRIAAVSGQSQPPNDMLDERERLIARLSALVKVSRVDASDGTVGLFVAAGQRLVLGASVSALSVVPDAADASRSGLALRDGDALRPLEPGSLGGGEIAGLLRFQNVDLVDGRNLIDRMAAAVGGAVNNQQMRGLNLLAPLGTVASSAIFGLPTPLALPNAANVRDASGAAIGSVNLAINDYAALQASDYDLREDPAAAGTYVLTRLMDGKKTSVADGDVVDGLKITFGGPGPGPQPGDSFLLQGVGQAARNISLALTDPRGLAAAQPLVASLPGSNSGTAAVQSLSVNVAPLPNAGASSSITFIDDNGGYTWDLFDAGGAVIGSGAGTWAPGQRIPAAPADINGFSLTLSGVPRTGDVLNVEPTPVSALASNNGNALALLGLRDVGLVNGETATEAYAQAMSAIGVRVQGASTAAQIAQAVSFQAEQNNSANSGVNLDEEAARLIQFQQSYQASAKMLQVAQTLFDTLLQTTGG